MAGKVIIIDSVDLVEVDLSPRYAFLRLVPLPDPEADDSKPEAKAESKAGGNTSPISIDPDAEPATKAGRYPGAYPVPYKDPIADSVPNYEAGAVVLSFPPNAKVTDQLLLSKFKLLTQSMNRGLACWLASQLG